MTTLQTVEASGASTRSPRTKGLTITVRLFPEVHGTVLEALARVPCGSRSARVIHLLTIGLMCERVYGTVGGNAAPGASPTTTSGTDSGQVDMRSDDLAFVSALMENAEG